MLHQQPCPHEASPRAMSTRRSLARAPEPARSACVSQARDVCDHKQRQASSVTTSTERRQAKVRPPLEGPSSGPAREVRSEVPSDPRFRLEPTQDLSVRADQAVLGVAEAALAEVGPNDRLGAGQVGPGHRREEVVLDLVVETPEHEVRERTADDVSGGGNLTADKTHS